MSFSHEVKEELCRLPLEGSLTQMSELEAMLRLSSEVIINSSGIVVSFQTSYAQVCSRFLTLLKNYIKCDVSLVSKKVNKLNQNNIYYANVGEMSDALIEEFGLLGDSSNKDNILQSDSTKSAYLRGAFLTRGSVNSPKSSNYHLEMYTTNEHEAIFIQQLMNYFNLNAKITKRRESLVIYLKELEAIKDFLRIIGTSNAVFEMEEAQIEREMSQSIKRQINIEGANDAKALKASKEQIKFIRVIEYNYPLEKLDGKLLMVMKVRKQNPEASLNELIEIMKEEYNEKITKSGLNHRFRKLKEIADKILEESKQ